MGEAGPSTLTVGKHGTSTVFVRALGSKKLHCVLVDEGMSTLALWEQHVAPHLWASSSLTELRLVWGGRTLEISADKTVGDHGIPALATLEVLGRLPSQGFSRLHQLMEHLLEALAPAAPAGSPPPADDETPPNNSREPIMHAVDAEIARLKSQQLDSPEPCSCLSCTGAPNSTLTLCGALLHCTDAAVVNVAYRVSQVPLPSHRRPAVGRPARESGSHVSLSLPRCCCMRERTARRRWSTSTSSRGLLRWGRTARSSAGCTAPCRRHSLRRVSPSAACSRSSRRTPPHPTPPTASSHAARACIPHWASSPSLTACSFLALPPRTHSRQPRRPHLSSRSPSLPGGHSRGASPQRAQLLDYSWALPWQAYDAKTHPLLWQHPTRKQALLELAARSHWPALLYSLLPALQLSRLAASGTLSAVSMVGYKALMSMANHGRHELLSLLLQTGIISAQHALLLLESVLQKKGKLPATERVVAEILQYIGPAGSEATSVLKVAAANSSANVLAMLLDWSHQERKALDLQLVCVALAEACESDNSEAMQLLLGSWVGQCTALQAQPLLRAFAARGDATTVGKLLSRSAGATSMVAMDAKQRVQLASCGLAHAAGAAAQRTKVLRTLLDAGAEPKGAYGELALRNAARDGQVESMQLLLDVGTNVNAVDEDGKTTLCVAACSGCCAAVSCLLQHGAQVRMRCHDGREPLDFAADSAVRQLLLAEVEKLRMGLLDELLADEDSGGKGGKGGGKAPKNKNKANKKGKDQSKADDGADASSADAAAKPSDGAEPDGAPSLSKAAKKKQKKAKSANGPENGGVAQSAADGAVEAPGAASAAENTSQEQRPSSEAASRNPAKKNSKASGKGGKDAGGPSQLREAAIDVLSGQARLHVPA